MTSSNDNTTFIVKLKSDGDVFLEGNYDFQIKVTVGNYGTLTEHWVQVNSKDRLRLRTVI